ncbi:hypothetical protein [Candidatus Thiodictyon syntrophicum]|jgi:hypothetical protein|uniref:Uncharacterized protein n=1 Tax=Candidatus Thiodictyon syntrophicum TaxID=1166950 RepID=A0A2K8U397_9GAMM|nr:hypothetical protein [Candidatus Thiodictyon syntrophicum]AUB80064.1 hypothetical protein THSYN_03180 [Candidatus Thiodictyon syntrophicum]
MLRVLSRIILVGFLVFASLSGRAEELAPADRVKLLEGSRIPAGSQITFGPNQKVAKLEIPAGGTLKFPKGSMVAQLTFPDPCTLEILADDTVTTDTDGVSAKDGKRGVWISRAMTIEGKTVYGFVKKQ